MSALNGLKNRLKGSLGKPAQFPDYSALPLWRRCGASAGTTRRNGRDLLQHMSAVMWRPYLCCELNPSAGLARYRRQP
jgi:hypothetical protein